MPDVLERREQKISNICNAVVNFPIPDGSILGCAITKCKIITPITIIRSLLITNTVNHTGIISGYFNEKTIKDETRRAAKRLKKDPTDYALYGGEDFELIFTVNEKNLNKVKGFLVGEITKRKGVNMGIKTG